MGVNWVARGVFAILVLATVAAFFVTQRLKHSPTVVQDLQGYLLFSPYSRNGHSSVKFSFRIKRADEVTVTIVDPRGDDVAALASFHLAAYTQKALRWNGRTDAGPIAPDGRYRIRVRLRDQGRSALLAKAITLDTAAPRPVITGIGGPTGSVAPSGPAILPLPDGGPLTVSFAPDDPGDAVGVVGVKLAVYRTDVAPARLITELPVAPGATSTTWDGRVRGRSVGPGTYLVAISSIDQAGNFGSTPALPVAPRAGEVVRGRAGITVRYLGVQPPVVPVSQDAPLVFGVDARRVGYAWSVTRVGAGRPRKKATGARPLLRMRPPTGISGVYVLELHTRSRHTAVPFAVQAPGRQGVLVVLPAIAWLGQDPVDDDGDGLANTLDAGDLVRTDRIFAGAGLPAGFPDRIAPLIAYLDAQHLRYDVTTDLALASGQGPGLAGHTGVLLAGDERWLTSGAMAGLRGFVRGGGKLASFGVDSLRRSVKLSGDRLSDPSPATAADAFGARLAAVAASPGPVTVYLDRIGLFTGGGGQFAGYGSYEATVSVGPDAQILASAVTADGRPVIVAVRYGRGLLVRTGLPELAGRLDRVNRVASGSASAGALVKRIWALLSA